MDPALLHLLLILSGVVVILAALAWFGRVRGGFLSIAGLVLIALVIVGGWLVLAGVGLAEFPGGAS